MLLPSEPHFKFAFHRTCLKLWHNPGLGSPHQDPRTTSDTPSTSASSSPSPTSSRSPTRRASGQRWGVSRRRATAGPMCTTWTRTPSTPRWWASTRVPQVTSDNESKWLVSQKTEKLLCSIFVCCSTGHWAGEWYPEKYKPPQQYLEIYTSFEENQK